MVEPKGGDWPRGAELTATVLKGDWKATEQQGVYGRVNTRWEYEETEVSRQKIKADAGAATTASSSVRANARSPCSFQFPATILRRMRGSCEERRKSSNRPGPTAL